MLSAYFNSVKIPELRRKILFTFGIIALCRVASNIPCPGVDPEQLGRLFEEMSDRMGGGIMGIVNIFSGGAMQKFAVAALGIMPYISASIIMQMMTPVIPALEKLQREGDTGRQKINQYTRYLTVAICLIQGTMFAKTMANPQMLGLPGDIQPVLDPGPFFTITTVIILTAGTMFLVWLGEQISEFGIGNGASLIITINIVASLPGAVAGMARLVTAGGWEGAMGQNFTIIHLLLLLAAFFAVCAGTVALTQGQRKIPVKHARRMGGTGSVGQTSYLPLRVNYAGVMPIIFASAVMMFPTMLISRIPYARTHWQQYLTYGSGPYMAIFAALILGFAFFWVANQFNPIQISDDLQKRGGYVPGIRPGQPTAQFLDYTMTRVTTAGSICLVAIAVLPMVMMNQTNIPQLVTRFFGGTSLLIMVGVILDTMRQIEGHLMSHHYDGFLKKGHLRSRRQTT